MGGEPEPSLECDIAFACIMANVSFVLSKVVDIQSLPQPQAPIQELVASGTKHKPIDITGDEDAVDAQGNNSGYIACRCLRTLPRCLCLPDWVDTGYCWMPLPHCMPSDVRVLHANQAWSSHHRARGPNMATLFASLSPTQCCLQRCKIKLSTAAFPLRQLYQRPLQ